MIESLQDGISGVAGTYRLPQCLLAFFGFRRSKLLIVLVRPLCRRGIAFRVGIIVT